jgi:hypothetical protein
MSAPTTSTTVNYGRPNDVRADQDREQVFIDLDDDRNEGKTEFGPGESAFFDVIPPGADVETSAGTARKIGSNIPTEYTECITFADSAMGKLSQTPLGAVDWEWRGRAGGTPKFIDDQVFLNEPVVGVLCATYEALGDRWQLTVTDRDMGVHDEMPVVVIVEDEDGNKTDTTITWKRGEGDDPAPVATDIEVRDFCTDEPVAGIRVHVNGALAGTTNAAGVAYLGMLIPGRRYALRVTDPNGLYVSSEADVLSNDAFTIPLSG